MLSAAYLTGVIFLVVPIPAAAEHQPSLDGINAYQRKDYKEAIRQLQTALKANPYDYTSIYYLALSYQQSGDTKNAKLEYGRLIDKFGYTSAAKNAQVALSYLDPSYLKQLLRRNPGAAPVAATTPAAATATRVIEPEFRVTHDFDNLPNEARIYFQWENKSSRENERSMIVDASVNNRSIKMVFDTAAEDTVFGKNHLRQLGVQPPEGPAQTETLGVGSSKGTKTWFMRTNIKVGSIERKNFPISVQEELPTEPLLGQTFFKDFHYTVDSTSQSPSIKFIKKTRVAAAPRTTTGGGRSVDRNSVPFRKEGNELVVMVEVNGRPMAMFFDTGAVGCSFSKEHIKSLNLQVPDDAQEETATGIGGSTQSKVFNISRIKMGPIDRSDFAISVVDQTAMKYPLLGQSFLTGWQYTIDNNENVIRFLRR